MKIIVLGGGLVGSAIVADLCNEFEVTCADNNDEALKKLSAKYGIDTLQSDLRAHENVRNVIAPFDLVVCAVPGFMGFQVLKTIVETGKNVVDISFFGEDALRLDGLAKKNNVTAIVDCGVAPGMSNMIAGYHNAQMKMSKYECLVGGLPVVREFPFEYKAVFSPIDVIEEYTRPARYVENGNLVVKEALTDIEEVVFENIGTLESFNSDGLRSLAKTLPHVPNMIEKTLRYPGHAKLMLAFRETGLFGKEKIMVGDAEVVPLEMTAKLMFPKWKLKDGEEDFTIMRVTVEGEGSKGKVKHVYTVHDYYDRKNNVTSMARTTAYTCTAAVHLVASGKYSRKGISPPEYVGAEKGCFEFVLNYLKKRNVIYEVKTTRS